jgi:polar amino acid transport system ATP-binding protein
MIEFREVSKRHGNTLVLDRVSLRIAPGETVVVCGPSGSGKSTLLRTINRLEPINGGSILLDGLDIHGPALGLNELRARVGFVFQGFNLFPHLTALQNCMLAPMHVLGLAADVARVRAMELLARMGLADRAAAWPAQLSGGQQQRVAIARALAMQPAVLLLDEPTSALDPEMVSEVLLVIRDLAHQGMTLVCVTHELGFAREVADRIVFIDGGRIVEVAPAATFFDQPTEERTRQFLAKLRSPFQART